MGMVPSIYVNYANPIKVSQPESIDEKLTKLTVTILLSSILLIVLFIRNLVAQKFFVYKDIQNY